MNRVDALPKQVKIVEVGPRDGLQNLASVVPTQLKLEFIAALAEAGIRDIEATSFVSPKAIPQLADADALYRALPLSKEIRFSALVPNERGMIRAVDAGAKAVAVFTAASDSFTRMNLNMTIEESFEAFATVFEIAQAHEIPVRAYVSTAFYCPYEGAISPVRVCEVVDRLIRMGAFEVSLGDTIGAAVPSEVAALLEHLLHTTDVSQLAVHFHDTRGTALANVLAALQMGICSVDAAAGGLGGCPFAPGASGNLATEDLVYMLDRMGIQTGVSVEQVCKATLLLSRQLGIHPTSKMYEAWASTQASLLSRIST